MPGLLVTWDRNGNLSDSFGLANAGLPEMIMLHRNGSIAEIDIGYDKSALDALVAGINTLMAEPAPPALASVQGDRTASVGGPSLISRQRATVLRSRCPLTHRDRCDGGLAF